MLSLLYLKNIFITLYLRGHTQSPSQGVYSTLRAGGDLLFGAVSGSRRTARNGEREWTPARQTERDRVGQEVH